MQIPPTITTLIWDLDGTIVDSLGLLEIGLAEVLPKYGFPIPKRETLLKNFHGTLKDSIHHSIGEVSEETLEAILQAFLLTQHSHYEDAASTFYEDAVDLARRAHAKGLRQILVTNRAHTGNLKASPRSIVADSELKDYIDTIICADDSEYRKPALAVLGALHEELDPATTMIIGDQFVDAQFAHNLGTQAVLIDRVGEGVPHLEQLHEDVHSKYTVVRSLSDVTF